MRKERDGGEGKWEGETELEQGTTGTEPCAVLTEGRDRHRHRDGERQREMVDSGVVSN